MAPGNSAGGAFSGKRPGAPGAARRCPLFCAASWVRMVSSGCRCCSGSGGPDPKAGRGFGSAGAAGALFGAGNSLAPALIITGGTSRCAGSVTGSDRSGGLAARLSSLAAKFASVGPRCPSASSGKAYWTIAVNRTATTATDPDSSELVRQKRNRRTITRAPPDRCARFGPRSIEQLLQVVDACNLEPVNCMRRRSAIRKLFWCPASRRDASGGWLSRLADRLPLVCPLRGSQ